MGGYGSGRHGGTATAESTGSYVLPITSLKSTFHIGERHGGQIAFDEGRFPVLVIVDLRNEWNCFIELIHSTRDREGENRTVFGKVQLTRTQPTFGGHRWWFLCPRTGYRTTKLFPPNGGRHFWSRRAYRLGYACQREDTFCRLQRRAAMLNRQRGGEGWSTWARPPQKPKWMRWRTYLRKYERWERVVERANEEFVLRSIRILGPGPPSPQMRARECCSPAASATGVVKDDPVRRPAASARG